MYCVNAIVQVAVINLEEKLPPDNSMIDPKKRRKVQTVTNVDRAMPAELKAIVRGFFVMRRDEKNPSMAANKIAASPSNSSNARKMKTSEIEIYESNRKNRTTIREPRNMVTTTSRRNGSPRSDKCAPRIEKTTAAAPAAATPLM
jgi:hypothetical protein